jgi:TRAP transporter TAXI family solute receptor
MKFNKMTVVTIVLSLILTVSGCQAPPAAAPAPDVAEAPKTVEEPAVNITMGTGGMGGPLQAVGAGWGSIIHKYADNVNVTVAVTGGGNENQRLIAQYAMDIGFTATPDSAVVVKEGGMYNSLRGLFTYHYGGLQLATTANSGISSFADLKGKKISMGAPGSALESYSKLAMKAHGFEPTDYKGELLNLGTAASMLKDGTIDAAFYFSPVPISHLMDVSSAREIRMIPFTEDGIEKFMAESKGWKKGYWEADSYPNMANTEPVMTVMTSWTLFTHDKLDDKVVNKVLTALFDNLEEFYECHPGAKEVVLEKAVDDMQFPMHPAAKQFFEDRGVKVQ